MRLCVLTLILSLALPGCATSGSKLSYVKGENRDKLLKDVSDEKALDTAVMIYNARPQSSEDEISRSIAFDEYINALKKRKSAFLKESGVFELKCEPADLKKLTDSQILELYDYLDERVKNVDLQALPEATEDENSWRIIHMTARDAVAREGYRREGLRNLWTVFGQVLNVALAVAVSAI